jgi:hypothetical protein
MTEPALMKAANQDPLNQHARQLLLKAKQKPDASSQYCLQLMRWAKESGQVKLESRYREALEGTLDNLQFSPNPQQALDSLRLSDSQDVKVSSEDFRKLTDPVEAAELLWEELHSKLGATLPGYHPQPP